MRGSKRSGAVLYYGSAMPDLAAARRLRGQDVVLQPYHRLVAAGGFADAFPRCRRYVYWNPTAVALDDPEADHLPSLSVDSRWGLRRLDLDDSVARRHVVKRAAFALGCDGGRIDGLFVDDLDLLIDSGRSALALDLIREVSAAVGNRSGSGWFVNRGFSLWPLIPRLDAVLLENLGPADLADLNGDQWRWLERHVVPSLHNARRAGAAAYTVSYRDRPAGGPSGEAVTARRDPVSRFCNSHLTVPLHLDSWNGSLSA